MPKLNEFKQKPVAQNEANREEIVRNTTQKFLDSYGQRELKAQMKQGYQDMSEVNLLIAEEYHIVENEATIQAEQKAKQSKNGE